MEKLVGAAIFGQSGGPTSVINSSAAGVIITALKQGCITKVYGAAHGIKGMLEEEFYDMSIRMSWSCLRRRRLLHLVLCVIN